MIKEPPSEFSLHVHRGTRRTQVIAAARGAPAMLLAIAVLVLAVAFAVFAVYWLRAPIASMGHRSTLAPGELPTAVDRVGPR